ncbi:MAG: tripartite tricarboxylate transporter substrate binding protein [Burkholderiales bacterium]
MKMLFSISLVVSAAVALPAIAQQYPAKAVRMIVGFPAGGTSDIMARLTGQKLSEAWGQTFIIDNRPGAGGNIGTELVAKSPPDGYTLLVSPGSTLTSNPAVYSKVPFDTVRDFAPVTVIAGVPNALVVHPSVPVNNVKELIALAKSRPGQLAYASTGAGQSTHLSAELLKLSAGINMIHVPYKGSAPALTDIVAGQVSVMFDNLPSCLPFIKSGRLKPLAVSSTARSRALPELPTVAESGLAGFDVTVWFAVLAPAATSRDIINRLNGEIIKAIKTPDMRDRLAQQGADPVGNTPEEFAAVIKRDLAKWAKVVKDANIKLD